MDFVLSKHNKMCIITIDSNDYSFLGDYFNKAKRINAMKRPYTDAQARANKKYQDSTDEIRVRTTKGNKKIILDHAMSQGESIGQFVNRAIFETIERDKKNNEYKDN